MLSERFKMIAIHICYRIAQVVSHDLLNIEGQYLESDAVLGV